MIDTSKNRHCLWTLTFNLTFRSRKLIFHLPFCLYNRRVPRPQASWPTPMPPSAMASVSSTLPSTASQMPPKTPSLKCKLHGLSFLIDLHWLSWNVLTLGSPRTDTQRQRHGTSCWGWTCGEQSTTWHSCLGGLAAVEQRQFNSAACTPRLHGTFWCTVCAGQWGRTSSSSLLVGLGHWPIPPSPRLASLSAL